MLALIKLFTMPLSAQSSLQVGLLQTALPQRKRNFSKNLSSAKVSFGSTFLLGALLGLGSMAPAFAATELTDRALRQQTEANHSDSNMAEVLDCDKDMSREACNRLQYERYAKQTDRSYDEFLRNETTNPLRNQVIKQPLLTQPLENPTAPPASRLADLSNQAPLLPNNLP